MTTILLGVYKVIFRRQFILLGLLLISSIYLLAKLLQYGSHKAILNKLRLQVGLNENVIFNNLLKIKTGATSQNLKSSISDDLSRCQILSISPFSKDIMKLMGSAEHQCKTKLNFQHGNKGLSIKSDNVNYIRYREIRSMTNEDKYSTGEYNWIEKPNVHGVMLTKGKKGFIQHVNTKKCLRFEGNNKDPSSAAPIEYGIGCNEEAAEFSFEESGLLRHIASGKCLEPQHADKDHPPDNTYLVLGSACKSNFRPHLEGLIQHVESGMCFHPYGGATHPDVGQKVCLFNACVQEDRLKYRWFVVPQTSRATIEKKFTVPEELVEIQTQFNNEHIQTDFYAHVIPTDVAKKKVKKSNGPDNIVVVAIDQTSAAHIQRKLPKSLSYLKDEMKAWIFQKHTTLSLGELNESFLAMLKGKSQPTAQKSADLFEQFNEKGYITLLNVDKPTAFGLDFKEPKADHSSSALGYYCGRFYDIGSNPYCFGSQLIHNICLDYVESFLNSYDGKGKFALSLLTMITHWNANALGLLDDRLKQLLTNVQKLKNTLLIVTSIRGTIEGQLGQSEQGKFEARLPFLAIYASPDLQQDLNFKDVEKNLNVLTTPGDIYSTLITLISDNKNPTVGSSLLHKMAERNCSEAAIPQKTCPCLKA